MKQQLQRTILSGLLLAGWNLQGQTSAARDVTAQLASLRALIQALSAEVAGLRLEIQRQKIADLQTEISRAEGERAILEQEQQIVQEETADLSKRLADPLTAPDEIADLREALHSRVSAGTDDLRRQLDEVRSREHTLAIRLTAVRKQHAQTLQLRERLDGVTSTEPPAVP
jgi:chromosome segregation ATPase